MVFPILWKTCWGDLQVFEKHSAPILAHRKDVRKWGYLYQRQEAVGLWKKRFFVLSEKSLVSYAKEFDPKDPRHDPDDETSKNIRGFTDLSGASVRLVEPSGELDRLKFTASWPMCSSRLEQIGCRTTSLCHGL